MGLSRCRRDHFSGGGKAGGLEGAGGNPGDRAQHGQDDDCVRGEKICDEIVKKSEEKESDTAKKERDITEMIAYGAAVFALVSLFVAAVAVCVRKMKKKRRTRGRKKKAGKRSLKRRKR